MPDSGTGIGTPITVPDHAAAEAAYTYPHHMSLARYQELMDLPIAAFNGLNNPDEYPKYECNNIWQPMQRAELVRYLAQAEERRERLLGYYLSPKYIVDERHDYGQILSLEYKHLIYIGKIAASTISTSEALALGSESSPNDPVTITVSTSVTDPSEINVFHAGTTTRIVPSAVSIASGVATIEIPRSRLVDPSLLLQRREDPLNYYENDNFVTTVDVVRIYNDPADAVSLVWSPEQLALFGVRRYPNGTEQTQTAMGYIKGYRARRLSKITVYPATYASGVWTGVYPRYSCPAAYVDVSYLSGIQRSNDSDLMTIRLAHTFMPNAPCSCAYVEQMWKADSKEAPWTPYGNTAGAMAAWLHDSQARIGHGGQLR